jgi:hypothetical protein
MEPLASSQLDMNNAAMINIQKFGKILYSEHRPIKRPLPAQGNIHTYKYFDHKYDSDVIVQAVQSSKRIKSQGL